MSLTTETAAPPELTGPRHGPRGLSHLAYVTQDTEATVRFWTEIMKMPLCDALLAENIPSTGDEIPYIHTFFRMHDGSTVAFFESVGLPPRPEPSHPAYLVFDHLALEVARPRDVDEWRTWLISNDIEGIGPVDHGIVYSVYFHDPNG